jgi:uncharacterized phage protein (TIGR02218 family)
VSFNEYEISTQASRPVELYVFTYEGEIFRFTSYGEDIEFDGNTYTSVRLERSDIEETGDIAQSDLNLTTEQSFDMADFFNPYPPSGVLQLGVYRYQADDPSEEVATLWLGRVLNVTWPQNSAILHCESVFTGLKRNGLRRPYGRNCPHVLYGAECNSAQIAHQHDVTVDTTDGTSIISVEFASFADGWFGGGKIEWTDDLTNRVHRRGIRSHAGTTVIVSHPITDMPNGATITIFDGCDRTPTACETIHANMVNYGGFLGMQKHNPFGTSSVF